jgi:pimeloyl-ACP methyl ester carboxylesterase
MLAFERAGSGRPVVLVHGITESRRTWDPIAARLSGTYDVLAVDLRGHGESPRTPPYDLMTLAGDLAELVDDTGIEDPMLVGHSLGGAVVTAYAALFDNRGVISVDQPLQLGPTRQALLAIEPALRGGTAEFAQAITAFFATLRGRLPDDEWQRIEGIRSPDQEVVLGIWSTLLDTPTDDLDRANESLLSGIEVPYFSFHGTDPGPEYLTWLKALVPTTIVEVWDGDGHYPHLVEPDRFVERLLAFDA